MNAPADPSVFRIAAGPLRLRVERRTVVVTAVVFVVVCVLAAGTLMSGPLDLGVRDVAAAVLGHGERQTVMVVGEVRLPRVITALAVGGALGASGAVFQSISGNALGSPDIIGFTTGAATGAVAQIVFFDAGAAATALAAVASGLLTASAVYALSRSHGKTGGYTLVLIGIGVSAILGALNTLMLVRGDLDLATKARIWLSGSLNSRTWDNAIPAAIAVAVCLPVLIASSRSLDAVEMGDDQASQLGVQPERVRQVAILTAVVLTAAAVAAAGPIAFIALAAPQIAHRLTGAARVQVVSAALMGAALLLAADLLSVHLPVKIAMPVGLTTGLLGGIYLLWLLSRARDI